MKLVHRPLSWRRKALLALFAALAALALVALAVRTAPASAFLTDECAVSVCDYSDGGGGGAGDDGSSGSTDSSGNSSFEGSEYGNPDTGFEGSEYGTGAGGGEADNPGDYQGYETTDERADHPTDPEPPEDSDPLAKYKYQIDSDNHNGYKPGESEADHDLRLLRNDTCWPILRQETRLHRQIRHVRRDLRFFGTAEEELDALAEEYFEAGCGSAMRGIVRPN